MFLAHGWQSSATAGGCQVKNQRILIRRYVISQTASRLWAASTLFGRALGSCADSPFRCRSSVLDCASPLALSTGGAALQKRQRVRAVQDLAELRTVN